MRHCLCTVEDLVEFFYNSTILCIVKFTGHLLSDKMLLAVREWEREGMGIANGNGNKAGLYLGLGMGMGGNGIEKDKKVHGTLITVD